MVIPAFAVAALMSFTGGAIIMMQAPINARLGSVMGGPLWAAFLSFLVGTIALAAVLLISRKAPSFENIFQTSAWMWTGGLLGAMFVFATIFSVPKLGAGLMIVLIVSGQMVCAIAMDHYGFLVPEAHSASLLRILGAGLVMAGAWLVYKG